VNLEIVWAGRPLQAHEQAWIGDYLKRARKFTPLEITRVKEHKVAPPPDDTWLAVLDSKGPAYTTEGFAKFLASAERSRKKRLRFLIGGAYGVPEETKKRADGLLSLSPLTLPHRLALLVLTEQIYRVLSWRAGAPYHHA